MAPTSARRTAAKKADAERPAPAAIGRDDVTVVHPLDRGSRGVRMRDVIGDRRADELATRAASWAEERRLNEWTDAAVAEDARETRNPFARLDRAAARETVQAEARVARLGTIPEEERSGSQERLLLRSNAITQNSALDRWYHGPDGAAAVRAVALRHELDIRREIAVQRAFADPPTHLLDAIGPRPPESAPPRVREGWDALARRFVREGPEQDADRPPDMELWASVDRYREAVELPAREVGPAIEPPAVEVDAGAAMAS
jgi:hypothetical protein